MIRASSGLYRRQPNAVSANLGDELAVLDMRNGSYLGFNATAAYVWRLLEQPQSLESLCQEMTAQYEVEEQHCRSSVGSLLQRLETAGLIVREDG